MSDTKQYEGTQIFVPPTQLTEYAGGYWLAAHRNEGVDVALQ